MSPSKEDYLKGISKLGGANRIVSNKELADLLDVKASSVTEMISRLVNDELITYTPYKGVQLTDEGVTKARQLIRKHRLWEVFLVDVLGYDWNEVHKEADRLEHASSDELMNRLDEFLDFPETDPHGAFIPHKDGSIDSADYIPLTQLEPGDIFTIKQVEDDDNTLLTFLSQHNITLDELYRVSSHHPSKESMTIALTLDDILEIDYNISNQLFVIKEK